MQIPGENTAEEILSGSQEQRAEDPTPTPGPVSAEVKILDRTDQVLSDAHGELAKVIPLPRNSGNYGHIYPLSVGEVVDRVAEHHEKIESGLLTRAAEYYGLNPAWIKDRLARPMKFGPAEQANPFMTVYAFAKAGTVSPQRLSETMRYEGEIEEGVKNLGVPVEHGMLTLKYDSLSSGGPTAIYDFRYPSWSSTASKPEAIVSKGKIDKSYEKMPYYDLMLPQANLKGILDSITVQSCRKGELKGKGEGQLRAQWRDRYGDMENFDQGMALFKDDIQSALRAALDVQAIKNPGLDRAKSEFNYYEFVTAFNRLVLARFTDKSNVDYHAVDQDCLDSLAMDGIDDWKTFLNRLSAQGFINLQTDTILRFAVDTPSGVKRFVRLTLAGSPSLSADGNQVLEENFQLTNLDTAGSKGGGLPSYRINDVLSAAREAAKDPDKRILFLTKQAEYFSLLSGLTNVMIGDDGIFHPDFVQQAEAIRHNGLGNPLLYTYCPHNVGNSSYVGSKEERITFNDDCSFIHFYVYMIELQKQKNATRQEINNLIK